MATTADVLEHHLTAFGEQDVEEIMTDYAEESVVVTNLGTFSGLEEIRGLFSDLAAEFSQPGMTMSVDQQEVEGEHAFIVWHAETADNVYEFATDTFDVHDDTIVFQTFAGKLTPKD